jgi:hypothetical protein
MTAIGSSGEFTNVRGVPVEAPAAVDFPGRWVGGLIGSLSSAAVGLLVLTFEAVKGRDGLLIVAAVCGLGIPVAFVVGRHLAPIVRSGGWSDGLVAAATFAVLAPPLGNVEIFLGPVLAPWIWDQPASTAVPILALSFTFGLGLSYVVLPITIAVGVVWAVLTRTLPSATFIRVRMPSTIDRLGVRHVFLCLFIWVVVVHVAWSMAGPPVRW